MDDAKVEQTTDSVVFEAYAIVSILRCDESPLDAEDREEVLDLLGLVVGDASNSIFTFISSFGPVGSKQPEEIKEPVAAPRTPDFHPDDRSTDGGAAIEEVQAAIHAMAHDGDDDDVSIGTEEPEAPTLASKECTACHAWTTQLDVNQCPMCGNPFV